MIFNYRFKKKKTQTGFCNLLIATGQEHNIIGTYSYISTENNLIGKIGIFISGIVVIFTHT